MDKNKIIFIQKMKISCAQWWPLFNDPNVLIDKWQGENVSFIVSQAFGNDMSVFIAIFKLKMACSMFGTPTFDEPLLRQYLINFAEISISFAWWHNQIETFSALLALCAGTNLGTKDQFTCNLIQNLNDWSVLGVVNCVRKLCLY